MAGAVEVRFESENFRKWLERLSADDVLAIEKSIGLEMAEVAREHLERHETFEGKAMRPWSEGYRRKVERSGERRDILLGPERRLHRSLTYEIRPDGIYYGSNLVYAAVHQWGWNERNIPARPYLGMGSDERQGIEDILDDFIERIGR